MPTKVPSALAWRTNRAMKKGTNNGATSRLTVLYATSRRLPLTYLTEVLNKSTITPSANDIIFASLTFCDSVSCFFRSLLIKSSVITRQLLLSPEDKLDIAHKLVIDAGDKGISLLLPVDILVTDNISNKSTGELVAVSSIPEDRYIVDIGPSTIELFKTKMKNCSTIFWNGPMGVYEIPQFASGTREMVKLLSELNVTTVIGGGSTAEIVEEMHLSDKMTHVSTGGGASLKFLEGKELPAVAMLLDK